MKSKINHSNFSTTSKIFFIFILLFSINFGFAQHRVKGIVLDSNNNKALNLVHILDKTNNTGIVSNEKGEFILNCKNLPAQIEISHISYQKVTVIIEKPTENMTILLKEAEYYLPEMTVRANKPINITKNKKMYVIDYDFIGDSIVLLSYKNQKLNKPCLVVLTKDGDTLQSKPLSKMDYLFKDCFDNEHIIEKDYAKQLYFNDKNIELIHPTSKDSFLSIFSVIIENYGNYFYLRQNTKNNQIVNYYIYNRENDSMFLMRQIIDEGGLERLSDKGRLQSAKGYTEADARFEEMCFYAPKIIEFVKTKDNLIVFNFLEDMMEFYDFDGKFIADKKIDFHKRNDWAKKMLIDEKTGKIFSLYEKNGLYSIQEISRISGKTTGDAYKIPDFAFVQKIKIYDGKIYFLYNDFTEYDYKQLYCMKM